MLTWRLGYIAGAAVLAAIDGAFLGGIAAIITAVGSIVLGVLAYRKGQQSKGPDPWEVIAHERAEELAAIRLERVEEVTALRAELAEVRRELDRERRRRRRGA